MSPMGGMPMPSGGTMSMAWMCMPGQTWLGAAASFLGMWVVMMVARMLPSVVPRRRCYRHFTANSSAITDADVTHYVKSYAAPQHLRAGTEFFRAFPANEQFNQEQQSPVDVPIVLAGGDKTFGHLLPGMAEALRKHGCTHVTTEVIKDSGHDVVDEQPTSVAALIERYVLR